MQYIKRILTIFLLLSLIVLPKSYAEEISFSSEVSTNRVALGSSFQLTLTISGMTKIGEMSLPPIDGFDIQYIGPSTHVSIVNGKYYSSKSFTYSITPLKTGKFTIQPFNITLKGKDYSTQVINIEVVDAQTQLIGQAEMALKDKINLVLRVPKKEVYINEALPVKIMLLVSSLSVRDIRYPQINNIGFIVDDYSQPKQYKKVINGIAYEIVEFDTVVYPTRTGELTLGPAQLDCNLLVKNSQRKSLGGLFNDDFFNAFFDRGQKKPMTLKSEPVTINVRNLPEADKPKDFSGAVGNYDFTVSAAPTDIKAGDPVTLRMNIKGRGNLKAIEFPKFEYNENFKTYQPNIKEEVNLKSLEQVIIPKSEDVKEVPPLSFSFFDPQLEKYRTITQGPFPLSVRPLAQGESLNIVGLQTPIRTQAPEEKLGEDIVFIKDNIGKLITVNKRVYGSLSFYAIIVLIILMWAGGFGYFKWSHRLATDEAFARKLKAPKQAKKQLQEAKALLSEGKAPLFYDTLFKALQNYLANKFQIPLGSVSGAAVGNKVKKDSIVKTIEDIFTECESVRYASATISPEKMRDCLHKAQKVIDYLERHVK